METVVSEGLFFVNCGELVLQNRLRHCINFHEEDENYLLLLYQVISREDDIYYTFLFQVIAREDKGSSVGIEYAYSRPATSLSNPTDKQKARLF